MGYVITHSRWGDGNEDNLLLETPDAGMAEFAVGLDYEFKVHCEDDDLDDDGKTVLPEGRIQLMGFCDEDGLEEVHDYIMWDFGFTDFQARKEGEEWSQIFG